MGTPAIQFGRFQLATVAARPSRDSQTSASAPFSRREQRGTPGEVLSCAYLREAKTSALCLAEHALSFFCFSKMSLHKPALAIHTCVHIKEHYFTVCPSKTPSNWLSKESSNFHLVEFQSVLNFWANCLPNEYCIFKYPSSVNIVLIYNHSIKTSDWRS